MPQRRAQARRSITLARCRRLVSAPLVGGALLCLPAPALAQANIAGTIRVESKEVLVPVLVVDTQRLEQLEHTERSIFWRNGYVHSLEPLAVPGLSLKDFTVLQDGREEAIVSVVPEEQKESPILTDNLSSYREYVGVGGGTWAVPLWEIRRRYKRVYETPSFAGYVIGFMAPRSPDRSCHKLQIMVDRPNSLVLARNEYCRASGEAADPLEGTRIGKRIESDLGKNRPNRLSLRVAAIPLFADSGKVRVRIVLDYAPQPNPLISRCDHAPATVGMIGTFLGEDGRVILRFSDEATRAGDNSLAVGLVWRAIPFAWNHCHFYAPVRYQTQVEIPRGKYRLEIALIDGRKFGRAEAAVAVPDDPDEQVSISGIALARRFRDPRMQPPQSPMAVSGRPFRDIPTEPVKSATELPEHYPPLISNATEVTPTANVRFERKDQFHFYVQVYEPRRSETPQPSVTLNIRIVNSKTNKVARQLQPINAAPYESPGNPIIPIGGNILIAGLSKGSYTLQAEATDSTGASTPWSSAAFTIQ